MGRTQGQGGNKGICMALGSRCWSGRCQAQSFDKIYDHDQLRGSGVYVGHAGVGAWLPLALACVETAPC